MKTSLIMSPGSNEFLAYEWIDPAPVVALSMRLVRSPFTPLEIANAWINGATKFEWWMTKIGGHPDHYHRFRIWKFDVLMEERLQWGYSGNFIKIEDDTDHKAIRSALK